MGKAWGRGSGRLATSVTRASELASRAEHEVEDHQLRAAISEQYAIASGAKNVTASSSRSSTLSACTCPEGPHRARERVTIPPLLTLIGVVAAALFSVSILTAIPSRVGARRPVFEVLQAEAG